MVVTAYRHRGSARPTSHQSLYLFKITLPLCQAPNLRVSQLHMWFRGTDDGFWRQARRAMGAPAVTLFRLFFHPYALCPVRPGAGGGACGAVVFVDGLLLLVGGVYSCSCLHPNQAVF